MGIKLINAIVTTININIEYNQDSWYQNQLDIQSVNADMTAGVTYITERSNDAYFLKPYCLEELS